MRWANRMLLGLILLCADAWVTVAQGPPDMGGFPGSPFGGMGPMGGMDGSFGGMGGMSGMGRRSRGSHGMSSMGGMPPGSMPMGGFPMGGMTMGGAGRWVDGWAASAAAKAAPRCYEQMIRRFDTNGDGTIIARRSARGQFKANVRAHSFSGRASIPIKPIQVTAKLRDALRQPKASQRGGAERRISGRTANARRRRSLRDQVHPSAPDSSSDTAKAASPVPGFGVR